MSDEIKKSDGPEDSVEADYSDSHQTNNKPISPKLPAGDQSLDSFLTAEAKKMNAGGPVKNKKQILYGAIAVILLVVVLMLFSCQPKQGGMGFGICSVYLELNTPYPQTLNYTGLEGSQTAVRIYYTSIDPFGEYKQEMIECTFGLDAATNGMKLTEIKRNRRPVDAEEIKKFNLLLPTIIASDPYRVLPPNWKNPLLKEEAPMYENFELPPALGN